MRMIHQLEAAAAAQPANPADALSPTAPMPRVASARPARTRSRSRRSLAALAVAATLAVGGGAAYASGALTGVVDALSGLFGSEPPQVALIDKLGVPLDVQATSDGITVTADAAIGDAHGYTAVFSIGRADGEPLDLAGVEELEGGALAGIGFAEASVDVEGVTGTGGSAWFYDADPADGTVQYAVQAQLATTDDGSPVAGRSATARFGTLQTYDPQSPEERATIAAGPWDLAFTFDYEDATAELSAGQQVSWGDGCEAAIEQISLSPIGLHVTYAMEGAPALPAESGREDPATAASVERYTGLSVSLAFADGSTCELTYPAAHLDTGDGERTVVELGYQFDRIVDLDTVTGVVLGDTEVPVERA